MSRAYRIAVKESIKRVVRARDHVSTQLEILGILPQEQMSELLGQQLQSRGFKQKGKQMVRQQKGVTVSVDTETGNVTVQSDLEQEVNIDGERVGRSYDDSGPNAKKVKEGLTKELREDLERQVNERAEKLQSEATDKLEGELGDLRAELNQVVNKVTAEALKQKAGQMGQIKEMTEDPQSGSLTIVVEV
jgi:hypothetical protein